MLTPPADGILDSSAVLAGQAGQYGTDAFHTASHGRMSWPSGLTGRLDSMLATQVADHP